MPANNVVTPGLSSSRESSVSTGVDTFRATSLWPYYLLFFVSGFPALIYQIVWERSLFTLYGVNVESVTVIVAVFMLGLGLGSLAGGKLSTGRGLRLLRTFGIIEISIGVFGTASLSIFHRIFSLTAGASIAATGVIAFVLLLIPTLLMGSTLPLLVAYSVRRTRNVGGSVASLYSVNTLGSGVACLAAAFVIMRSLGESGSVRLAALLNFLVGASALLLQARFDLTPPPEIEAEESATSRRNDTIPFGLGMFLAAATGFIALAYEIIWYRLYSFTSGGAAPTFAKLLGYYLLGIAYGSFAIGDICREKLKDDLRGTLETAAKVVILGSIAGFIVGPALGFSVKAVPYDLTFPFVFVAAALLGAAFPILSHAAIHPAQEAGRRISYLYLSNIVGSALGSFIVGFVILDHWSTRATSSMLLALGIVIAIVLAGLARPIQLKGVLSVGIPISVVLLLVSGPLYSHIYERLLFKGGYSESTRFKDLVENRSGVIAVADGETVFGGGVYDGRFNTDLVHDSNGIFRVFAIAGLHPDPKNVLVIGLSSGSWAQVLVNHPGVKKMTVVEINPGYLPLIAHHPVVASLLKNPKVDILIDDGRRWLTGHPERKFDFILMNTTFHWRANVSNLLSREFLEILRAHLEPGGIAYYNTTSSAEVQLTGSTEFPYSLRVGNFLAVSDSPITLDPNLWKERLVAYKIEGRPVLDLTRPEDQLRLAQTLRVAEQVKPQPEAQGNDIEGRADLLARWKGYRIITDDNMGTEWK
jgi:spermidine synthase